MNGGGSHWLPPHQQPGPSQWSSQQQQPQQQQQQNGLLDLSFFEAPAPAPSSGRPAHHPFAPSAADPFAPSGPTAHPFSSDDLFAAGDDPFGGPPNGFRATPPPPTDNPFLASTGYDDPFAPPPDNDNILGALDPDTPFSVDDEPPSLNLGAIEAEMSGTSSEVQRKEEALVLSRQDTFLYLGNLETGALAKRVEAARALKFLAFNATSEYKNGLIQGGLFRSLMKLFSKDTAACEHAASCMYSMAREHIPSKVELVRVGAHKLLAELLANPNSSKQLRLNACAALYAISCAGKPHVGEVAALTPVALLVPLLEPALGRTAQDDQMQLFAALLIVNLLHAKVGANGLPTLLGLCLPSPARALLTASTASPTARRMPR
jgi:hypothetical protein